MYIFLHRISRCSSKSGRCYFVGTSVEFKEVEYNRF
jgi:hypothetical protein